MKPKYPNSGILFKGKPSDNPKAPTYDGSATVDGVDYWLSAWVKDGDKGKFFSIAFKPKVPGAHAKPAFEKAGPDVGDGDNLPPF